MKSKKTETPNDATLSGKEFVVVMLALFAICCLIQTSNCTSYHPGNFPSYDVLVLSEIVKENPIAFVTVMDGEIVDVDWINETTKDGIYNLVNDEFLQWAYELKSEVKRLR